MAMHSPEGTHGKAQLLSPEKGDGSIQTKRRIRDILKDIQVVKPVGF